MVAVIRQFGELPEKEVVRVRVRFFSPRAPSAADPRHATRSPTSAAAADEDERNVRRTDHRNRGCAPFHADRVDRGVRWPRTGARFGCRVEEPASSLLLRGLEIEGGALDEFGIGVTPSIPESLLGFWEAPIAFMPADVRARATQPRSNVPHDLHSQRRQQEPGDLLRVHVLSITTTPTVRATAVECAASTVTNEVFFIGEVRRKPRWAIRRKPRRSRSRRNGRRLASGRSSDDRSARRVVRQD